MKNLVLALYSEGATDRLFLPNVIRRTSRRLLDHHGQNAINVKPIDPIDFSKAGLKQYECIVQAAYRASEYDGLIVHSDADHPTPEKALQERFQPGYQMVQGIREGVCKHLLPIIPIHATEAWMLADYEILLKEIRVNLSAHELGIPEKAKQVESISKPKQRLEDIISKANQQLRPRQGIDLLSLYEPLGRRSG